MNHNKVDFSTTVNSSISTTVNGASFLGADGLITAPAIGDCIIDTTFPVEYKRWNGNDWSTVLPYTHGYSQTVTLRGGMPTEVYFRDAAETVILKFGKNPTVVHTHEDKYDRVYGFLLAYFQANCGLTKNKANKYLESLCELPSQDKKKK